MVLSLYIFLYTHYYFGWRTTFNCHLLVHCRCVFSAITKLLRVPRLGCYFLVILFSDVMTIHFFFLVWLLSIWCSSLSNLVLTSDLVDFHLELVNLFSGNLFGCRGTQITYHILIYICGWLCGLVWWAIDINTIIFLVILMSGSMVLAFDSIN